MKHYTYSEGVVQTATLHSGISATATSDAQLCAGAKAVAFEFTRTGTRQGILTITVSTDGGTNFRAYAMLLSNLANTKAQVFTRVANYTETSAGTNICWLTPETLGAITHFKATVTIGVGAGVFSVKSSVAY